MSRPRKPPPVPQTSNLALVRTLEYRMSEDVCHPALRTSLGISVKELYGEDEVVRPGRVYMLRGHYVCTATDVEKLVLAGQGQSGGTAARIAGGEGDFEVTAEPLEVAEGMEHVLDLLAFGPDEHVLGIRMRFELKGWANKPAT